MAVTHKLIQQQYYTRDKSGIFRTSEGFDTIAKSPNLDNNFIKKVLHPFCVYDAPVELMERSEKDGSRYPDAVALFQIESGEMVLGRSIYVPADFTGTRSAFFTHNYVISPQHKEAYILSRFPELFHAAFEGTYDIGAGKELREWSDIPVREEPSPLNDIPATLQKLKIDETIFKQLLFAVASSAGGKKKVYISLDVAIEHLSFYANQLMEIVFYALPYELRRSLGFLTYAREPQSRKYINVTFVEKGSIRPGDRNIEKDYIFDLANNRIVNTDIDFTNQPYLDFVWNHLHHPRRLAEFHDYAELMLEHMDAARKTGIGSYHELCTFFLIEEGRENLYERNRIAVLRGMYEYLKPPSSLERKARLYDLLRNRLEREMQDVSRGASPDLAIYECIRDYYKIVESGDRDRIVQFLVRAVYNSAGEADNTAKMYALLESDPDLFDAFFRKVFAVDQLVGPLFEQYIGKRFDSCQGLKDVLAYILSWGARDPQSIGNSAFANKAESSVISWLSKGSGKIADVASVHEAMKRLASAANRRGSYDSFADRIDGAVDRHLLAQIEPDSLSKEELLRIPFLKDSHNDSWQLSLSTSDKSKYQQLKIVYRLITETQVDPTLFAGIPQPELGRIQRQARNYFKGELSRSQYDKISLLYISDPKQSSDYYNLLVFMLEQHSKQFERVHDFIKWSAGSDLFGAKGQLHAAYKSALERYFAKCDPDSIKKPKQWKKLKEGTSGSLSQLLNKIREDMQSGIVKWMKKNAKLLILSFLALILLVVLVFLGILIWNKMNGNKDVEQPPTQIENPGTGNGADTEGPGTGDGTGTEETDPGTDSGTGSSNGDTGVGTGTGTGTSTGDKDAGSGTGTGTSTGDKDAGSGTGTGSSTGDKGAGSDTGTGSSTGDKGTGTGTGAGSSTSDKGAGSGTGTGSSTGDKGAGSGGKSQGNAGSGSGTGAGKAGSGTGGTSNHNTSKN